MRFQVPLLLICTLFSKALSLTCHECVSSFGCEQKPCSNQCVTSTTSLYMGTIKGQDITVKTCAKTDLCMGGSINLGMMKMVSNAKCCSTDLCNSETLPAPPNQPPNGRMCYTCNGNDCTEKISCVGNEDHCITASVKHGGNTVSTKGCVSKSICTASESSSTSGISITNAQCCEGNLCNGAERFTLSFLLMLIPLLPFILFY